MYLGDDLTCYKHVRTFLLAPFSSLTHPFSVCKIWAIIQLICAPVGPLHTTNSVVKEKGIPAVTYDFQILPGPLFDKLMLQDHRCKMICILLYNMYQYVKHGCLICHVWGMYVKTWVCIVRLKVSFPTSSQWRQKLRSWFDGFVFLYIQKYSNVLMMLYLFHLVSRCWFQRFFYLGKTMSSPRFFKLKSLFGWMEWKRLRCMKKGVSVWAPRCRYLKVRASLTSRQGLQICFAVVWRELTGCWKHPQGSIALWCVHANVEVLQAFKQVVQYCQAKGNLQNGKPALKVAFR